MRTAPRSNARYVQHLFDQFSADYDARMIGHLAYRAPTIMRELAELVMGHKAAGGPGSISSIWVAARGWPAPPSPIGRLASTASICRPR